MKAIEILAKQFATTAKLYRNVLADIDDTSGKHPAETITRLRWLAGHLAVTRGRFALRMGLVTEPFPYLDIYTIQDKPMPNSRGIDLSIQYPTLETLRQLWSQYSDGLPERLMQMTDEQLATDGPFMTPMGPTLLDSIAFIAIHESYHIGQMGTLRRSLGYDAMSFR